MFQLLVNRFTVLNVEECEDNYSSPSDISTCLTCNHQSSPLYHPRWEKKLPLHPTINALNIHSNVHGIFLYLLISLKTTNTSRSFLIHALINSGATGVFINPSFVEKYGLNTHRLSKSVSVYNVNSIPNEVGSIFEVVDMVLQYNTHLEQILLTVSSLSRQNLILGFIQLKAYNPKVNWQQGEVVMMCCPTYCSGYQEIQNMGKYQAQL